MAGTIKDPSTPYVEKIDCEQAKLPGEREIRIKRSFISNT
jgi:hypothetical protein